MKFQTWKISASGKPSKKFISMLKRQAKNIKNDRINQAKNKFEKEEIKIRYSWVLRDIKDYSKTKIKLNRAGDVETPDFFIKLPHVFRIPQIKTKPKTVKPKTVKKSMTTKPKTKTKTVKKTKKVEIKKLEKKLEELDDELEDAYQKGNQDIIEEIEKDIEKTANKIVKKLVKKKKTTSKKKK
jgi:vacuolar-type H+-ATPase subunit H